MEATIVVLFTLLCAAVSSPVDHSNIVSQETAPNGHVIVKRYINLSLPTGEFSSDGFSRIRTKRSSEEECEKLALCKLHARSQRNFMAAFQLYFVNRENSKLWDHQAHSVSDCYQLYNCYR